MMRSGYFGLDVPIDGKFADPHLLVRLATEAERAGWDGFFLQDIVFSNGPLLDPIVVLSAIASLTEKIRIGAFMTAMPRRRPWKLARELLTLDLLSKGRIICGLGLGFQPEEFIPFGESADLRERAEKLDEGLDIMAGLWKGQPFRYEGKHFQLDLPAFLPKPVQSPRIPVWVSGGWPRRKPFQRAAQWDGTYLMTVNQVTREMLTPAEIREIKSYIFTLRKNDTPFDIAVNVLTPLDKKEGADLVKPFFEAGANWCIALSPETPEQYLDHIRAGPPKL